MNTNFADVVEDIKQLSFDEKEELRFLLEKYLIEEERQQIYNDYLKSRKELIENKLNFSDSIDNLREMLK